MPKTYVGTAAGLNGQTIASFDPGDQIEITDETPAAANVTVSGNKLDYSGGSITIDNLGPGRYVVRPLGSAGTDIRLQQDAHNDFNGDGRSDVLWQNSSGTVTDWLGLPDGSFSGNSAHLSLNVGTQWHLVGTGDFNGDGRVDALWQNSDGTLTDWLGLADGSFAGNAAHFSVNPGTGWQVVGTGDFNGDGLTDILLRNSTTGTVNEWDGQTKTNGSFAANPNVNNNVPTSWHVVGTGDFNGDGHDDVLWQNSDGTLTDWLGLADGSFAGNAAHFSVNPGTGWQVVGTGDFNGDGLTDILLRNSTTGTVNEWDGQTNGSFAANPNVNNNVPTSWHVVGIGDFNGDAIDDVLWQNTSGTVTDWLGTPDGSFAGNAAHFSMSVGTQWQVHDPFVHDPLV